MRSGLPRPCQPDNRPHIPTFSFIRHPILPFTMSRACSCYAHRCGSCEVAHHGYPRGGPWPHLPYLLAFESEPDLVLQDDGIDTVPALHATKGLDVVVTGVIRAVVPLAHEQTSAPSARSRVELLACGRGVNRLSPFALFHCSAARRFYLFHSPFHDSASQLLVWRDGFLVWEYRCVRKRWYRSCRKR